MAGDLLSVWKSCSHHRDVLGSSYQPVRHGIRVGTRHRPTQCFNDRWAPILLRLLRLLTYYVAYGAGLAELASQQSYSMFRRVFR